MSLKKSHTITLGLIALLATLLHIDVSLQKINWTNLPTPQSIPKLSKNASLYVDSTNRSENKIVVTTANHNKSLADVNEKAKLIADRIIATIDSAAGKTAVVNKSYQELVARLSELDHDAATTIPSELVTDSQQYVRQILFHYQETQIHVDNPSDAKKFVEKLSVSTLKSESIELINEVQICRADYCNYRYETSFNDQPIFGDALVLTTVRGKPTALSGHLLGPVMKEQKTKNKIDSNDAGLFDTALRSVQTELKPDHFILKEGYVRDEQFLYPAYLITLFSGGMPVAEVIVDSYSGAIVSKESLVRDSLSASGTDLFGNTQSFSVRSSNGGYVLEDDTLPVGFSTKVFDAGLLTWDEYLDNYLKPNIQPPLVASSSRNQGWSPDAVSVISSLYNLADYFDRNHEYRLGDRYLRGYEITVEIEMLNARAGGSQMFFGKTSTFNSARAADIVGHELTHSIIDATSDLYYYRESGALNESFADFFGEVAENKLNWELGEDAFITAPNFVRSMSNPTLRNQPAHMRNFQYTLEDNGGVHINSGIPNRFLYLLAQGLTREGLGNALGVEKTADLAFQTLLSLTPYSSFSDFFASFRHLAKSLYGDPSNELDAIQVAAQQVGFVADSVFSTEVGSSLKLADFNAVTSLRYNELTDDYDVYMQLFANQARSYFEEDEVQIGMGAALAQPLTLIFEDEDYVALFKKTNGDIYEISKINGEAFEGVLLSAQELEGLDVNSITLSADTRYLAIVFSGRSNVMLFDLQTSDLRKVDVTSPSYTDGFAGIPASRVDSIRFDPSGRKLALDFEVCSSESEESCYWSIALIDAETAEIKYPFPNQPSNYTVGYPAFGNIDTNKIAIDIVDTDDGNSAVYIYDTLTGKINGISGVKFEGVEGVYFGNPSFTADDSAIVFTASQSDTEKYVYTIPITQYERAGDAESLNPRPAFLARSEPIITGDQIPELKADTNLLEFATYTEQVKDICLINNGRFDVETRSVQFPRNFYSPQIPATISRESQSCFKVIFDANELPPQEFESVISIKHDGANSPLLISVIAQVTIDPSIDSDGDGIKDINDNDRDGDGYLNDGDIFPDDPSEWFDSDADSIGDNNDESYNPASEKEFLLVNRMDACDAPFDDDEVQWEINGVLSSRLAAGEAMRTTLPVGVHVFRTYQNLTLTDTTIVRITTNTAYRGWGCNWDDVDFQSIEDDYAIVKDSDGDLVADSEDALPLDRNESTDTDGDGIGNNTDTDDDGDGLTDQYELDMGSDPLDSGDLPTSGGLSPGLLRAISTEASKNK